MSGKQAGWRTVILCFDGDSNDVNAWSNIPYLLATELERRGNQLIRVNLEAPWLLRRLWRCSIGMRHKLRHWHTSFDFYRSRTNHWLTTRRLNKAVRRHVGSDTILINLSISVAPTRCTIPVVLLSDWSYHHYITEHLCRQPDRSEQATIDRDNAAMARASLVVLLFPESAARLQRQIPAGRFLFFGHVINGHPLASPLPDQPPASTPHSPWRLLFVGRPRYREGLELLLQALTQLPADLPVQLDVIGISPQEIDVPAELQQSVHLHGYLSKAHADQRDAYYSLLNQADLLINASARWGGFSATVEAMYRRTAVVTPPYDEFQSIFGSTIPFGAYLPELTPFVLAAAITSLLQNPAQLAEQQLSAHQAVASFTWRAFLDRLFAEVKRVKDESTTSRSLTPFIAGGSH
jgi:glycosyltransferase involved in cell wall biosynthesis